MAGQRAAAEEEEEGWRGSGGSTADPKADVVYMTPIIITARDAPCLAFTVSTPVRSAMSAVVMGVEAFSDSTVEAAEREKERVVRRKPRE